MSSIPVRFNKCFLTIPDTGFIQLYVCHFFISTLSKVTYAVATSWRTVINVIFQWVVCQNTLFKTHFTVAFHISGETCLILHSQGKRKLQHYAFTLYCTWLTFIKIGDLWVYQKLEKHSYMPICVLSTNTNTMTNFSHEQNTVAKGPVFHCNTCLYRKNTSPTKMWMHSVNVFRVSKVPGWFCCHTWF